MTAPAFRLSAKLPLAALLMASALAFAPVPVSAQSNDMRELMNRLGRLENELQTLSREVYRGGARPSGGGAPAVSGATAGEFEVRLQRLESEMQQLTGKYEETGHQLGQIRERLERLSADIDVRLTQLEQRADLGLGADPGAAPAAGGAVGPAPSGPASVPATQLPAQTAAPAPGAPAPANDPTVGTLPTGAAQERYDYAFNLIRQGDYANAEKAFRQFLREHPNHSLTSNAQYWMAETHYVRGQFKEAAIGFAEGYQKFPKSSKAPDSLLKLAMSLGNLNQKSDACTALRQLDADYKDAPATIKRRSDQEKNRLGCK